MLPSTCASIESLPTKQLCFYRSIDSLRVCDRLTISVRIDSLHWLSKLDVFTARAIAFQHWLRKRLTGTICTLQVSSVPASWNPAKGMKLPSFASLFLSLISAQVSFIWERDQTARVEADRERGNDVVKLPVLRSALQHRSFPPCKSTLLISYYCSEMALAANGFTFTGTQRKTKVSWLLCCQSHKEAESTSAMHQYISCWMTSWNVLAKPQIAFSLSSLTQSR